MKKKIGLLALAAIMANMTLAQKQPASLVPTTPSKVPDYYCTWNLQGFVTGYLSGSGSNDLRVEINEDNLFGTSAVWGSTTKKVYNGTGREGSTASWNVPAAYQGWLNHYPAIRQDLTFVMDDSWDIPKGAPDANGYCAPYGCSKRPDGSNYDNPYLAYVRINEERFPSYADAGKKDVTNMARLVKAVKKRGWRSLGGWICAQNPIGLTEKYTGKPNNKDNSMNWTAEQEEAYWSVRMQEAEKAGFTYWKVDWGNKDRDDNWRRRLSGWQRKYAPNLIVEHALMSEGHSPMWESITYSDYWRSYDVLNHKAQAQTLSRLKTAFSYTATTGKGIVNCEDEPYIAAALGCAIGVMRHPYVGNFAINNEIDTYFQEFSGGRQLCHRLNEIVRGVRWHRIAEPFGVAGDALSDESLLSESRKFFTASGDVDAVTERSDAASAPARMSRNMPLPEITGYGRNNAGEPSTAENRPYVLGCVYPNGCAAVSVINRNIADVYRSERPDVTARPKFWNRKVGVFGLYNSLTLEYADGLPDGDFKVYAQDLASDAAPTEIPFTKTATGKGITISGQTIEDLCGYRVINGVGQNTGTHAYPYSEVKHIPALSSKDYTDLSDPAIVLLISPTPTAR